MIRTLTAAALALVCAVPPTQDCSSCTTAESRIPPDVIERDESTGAILRQIYHQPPIEGRNLPTRGLWPYDAAALGPLASVRITVDWQWEYELGVEYLWVKDYHPHPAQGSPPTPNWDLAPWTRCGPGTFYATNVRFQGYVAPAGAGVPADLQYEFGELYGTAEEPWRVAWDFEDFDGTLDHAGNSGWTWEWDGNSGRMVAEETDHAAAFVADPSAMSLWLYPRAWMQHEGVNFGEATVWDYRTSTFGVTSEVDGSRVGYTMCVEYVPE